MVPVVREKANLSKYRKAGREVIEVLLESGATVERASIDEAYHDLTKLVEVRETLFHISYLDIHDVRLEYPVVKSCFLNTCPTHG